MADVKWIKIAVDIFDDEKILLIEQMPEGYAIVTVWFKLLCLAGKQNNSGVFIINDKIPYTDEMFATIFRMPLNIVRLALATFEQFGMVEIVNDTITIPKWGKHQNLDKIDERNQYMQKYMTAYRERQKSITEGCKVNGKVNGKVNVNSLELEEDIKNKIPSTSSADDDAFNAFWEAYPRKVGKAAARKAYAKVPCSVRPETILEAIGGQKMTEQWQKEGGRFIPHPATWLNQGRWEDEVPETTDEGAWEAWKRS